MFTMPFTFSVAEYADMIYVCGFCDGNSVHAVAEYQQRFPNHRIPTRRVFTRVYQTLRGIGTLPGVRIAAERDINEGVDKEGIIRLVKVVHVRLREELQEVFVFPTRECGEHCMQRTCIHTTCSECNISDTDRIRNSQRKQQRVTRAVHNRAAACVAAGGGILKNQL